MGFWSRAKEKLDSLVKEYGMVAVGTLITLRVVEFAAVWTAVEMGFEPEGYTASIGTFWAVMGATQLSKPFRIALAVALTPFVARWIRPRVDPVPETQEAPERPDLS